MKKHRGIKKKFLACLGKNPIVSSACDHVGISRQTAYRWRSEDPEFKEAMDEAISFGDLLVADMAESQMFSHVKSGRWPAIKYALQNLHPKYKSKPKSMKHDDRRSLPPDSPSFEELINRRVDTSNMDPKLIERMRKRREEKLNSGQGSSA